MIHKENLHVLASKIVTVVKAYKKIDSPKEEEMDIYEQVSVFATMAHKTKKVLPRKHCTKL